MSNVVIPLLSLCVDEYLEGTRYDKLAMPSPVNLRSTSRDELALEKYKLWHAIMNVASNKKSFVHWWRELPQTMKSLLFKINFGYSLRLVLNIVIMLTSTFAAEPSPYTPTLRYCHMTTPTRKMLPLLNSSLVPPFKTSIDIDPRCSKLFVESEYLPEVSGLVFHRRPRAADEVTPSMIHLLAVEPGNPASISYTSDRAEFIGRGRVGRSAAPTYTARLPSTFSTHTHRDC